jgi:putative phosphonate metabolism protein
MIDAGGRWAVYFAPDPGSDLARFGATWLGYDAATGAELAQPRLARIAPERLRAITAEPRRYGFHATLKPPFILAAPGDPAALDAAVARLAGEVPAFAAPPLRLARLAGFWALILSQPCPAIDRLAASCVTDLDAFRRPPGPAELARRRRAGLSPEQDALLGRWGYPYVMAEFRFHMTLTSRLDPDEGEVVRRALEPLVEKLCRAPLRVDAIGLFRQDPDDAPFRLVRRYKLREAASG